MISKFKLILLLPIILAIVSCSKSETLNGHCQGTYHKVITNRNGAIDLCNGDSSNYPIMEVQVDTLLSLDCFTYEEIDILETYSICNELVTKRTIRYYK